MRARSRHLAFLLLAPPLLSVSAAGADAPADGRRKPAPAVLLVTVDTLRADSLSSYGYDRDTTPRIDDLLGQGVRFARARTIEPLTGPALASMLTSSYPHRHGASRNGLRIRTGLASLSKTLQAHGYATAAFIGNWTLRDKLTGLAEHFEVYEEVLSRKRWFGLLRGEATAEDLTDSALEWLVGHLRRDADRPFLLWAHYTEPHAPYRAHDEYRERLGLPSRGDLSKRDRYDTEVAFVDAAVGRLLEQVRLLWPARDTLVVFAADHGESLGEHDYWGHGRNLYEPALRIPLGLTWPATLEPRTVEEPALIVDIAPTVLGLLRHASPASFIGFDWTPALRDHVAPPADRVTHYQAHKGVVISKHDSELARRSGLLEVGVIHNEIKEIFSIQSGSTQLFDLTGDPAELHSRSGPVERPSEGLVAWMRSIFDGLTAGGAPATEPLDEEGVRRMRSLGYVD